MVVSRVVYGETLTLGSGYQVIAWIVAGPPRPGAVALLLVLRAIVTPATVAGGGAGGLFVPLVVLGCLLGELCGQIVHESTHTLFPVIGVAAFLGAGYRTPLAAVVFVAESTGRPGFIVPGLIAAVVSQLVMGRESVSMYQSASTAGPPRASLRPTPDQRPSRLTSPRRQLISRSRSWSTGHLLVTRHTTVPVVDGNRFVGLVGLDDLARTASDRMADDQVGDVVPPDQPRAKTGWTIEQAVRVMDD